MPAAERLNDPNDAGAKITKVKQNTVFINNQPASIDGSDVAGHAPGPHSSPKTANGSGNVFIVNTPVNRVGDADTCGHPRKDGSPDVFING